MKRRTVRSSIVVGLAALIAAGCAARMAPDEAVAARQRLMKLNGASWTDAQAKAKAGNWEAIAVNAETMALNSDRILRLFPEGSLTEKSKAKPEIWQKWGDFESAVKNFQAQAEKLRDVARSKNAPATEAAMKDFGRVACGTCHTPFRVPPPRT
jgi:cytochrome c556